MVASKTGWELIKNFKWEDFFFNAGLQVMGVLIFKGVAGTTKDTMNTSQYVI